MEQRRQVQEFLASRRARITPQQAGLLAAQHNRRVPGLRREEVATLAGMSVDYYNRLERGNLAGASDGVLDALARALQLDDVERDHLFGLARAAQGSSARRRPRRAVTTVPAGVRAVLDALVGAPALVRTAVLDVIATNRLCDALYGDLLKTGPQPANLARFAFLDPRSRNFWFDWEQVADDTVAVLHAAAGRDPQDRALTDLVGELATRSEEFRTLWARHDVRAHTRGVKRVRHPVVGRIDLNFEVMDLSGEPGLSMTVYTAERGSTSHDTLSLLQTWAATQDRESEALKTMQSRLP